MSLSVVFIYPNKISFEDIQHVIKGNIIHRSYQYKSTSYTVENKDGYVSLDLVEQYREEYIADYLDDENIFPELKQSLFHSDIICFYYNSPALLNEILQVLLSQLKNHISDIWIDNDNAEIYPGSYILEELSHNRLWNIQQIKNGKL